MVVEGAIGAYPRPERNGPQQQRGNGNAGQDFLCSGQQAIGELEFEINKWQKSLGPKASVTHISTAMTEHEDKAEGWQTRMTVTIWYEL